MLIDQRFNQHYAVAHQVGGVMNLGHRMPSAVTASLHAGPLLPGRSPPRRRAAQPTR